MSTLNSTATHTQCCSCVPSNSNVRINSQLRVMALSDSAFISLTKSFLERTTDVYMLVFVAAHSVKSIQEHRRAELHFSLEHAGYCTFEALHCYVSHNWRRPNETCIWHLLMCGMIDACVATNVLDMITVDVSHCTERNWHLDTIVTPVKA